MKKPGKNSSSGVLAQFAQARKIFLSENLKIHFLYFFCRLGSGKFRLETGQKSFFLTHTQTCPLTLSHPIMTFRASSANQIDFHIFLSIPARAGRAFQGPAEPPITQGRQVEVQQRPRFSDSSNKGNTLPDVVIFYFTNDKNNARLEGIELHREPHRDRPSLDDI